MFHIVLGIVLGYLAGCVTPSIARKLHAILSGEAKKVGGYVSAEVDKAEKKL